MLFATGSVFAYFDRTGENAGPAQIGQTVVRWEVVVMGLGLAIVNLFLSLSKRRRAARLSVDPDADHPEAKVFE